MTKNKSQILTWIKIETQSDSDRQSRDESLKINVKHDNMRLLYRTLSLLGIS